MRRALLAAMIAPVLLAAAPAAARAPAWKPDVAAASDYAAQRPGVIAFAVRTENRLWGRRLARSFPSASVIKAMFLVSYLRRPSVRDRVLRPWERRLLSPMIRRSDNVAATRVRDLVGKAALGRLARAAGMTAFRPRPVWGLSRITAPDQTRFFLRIDRLMPPLHRAYGMHLLRTIVPEQRWGVARVAPAGWKLYFKGGWGAGKGAVEHQVALLTRGAERVSVAVLTVRHSSHAAGEATLQGVFGRLLKGLAAAR